MGQGYHISANPIDVLNAISGLQDQDAPFVTAYALTKTAQDIQAEEYKLMSDVFDRPTSFTLNSLYVQPATKQSLTAVVQFKDGFGSVPAWRYLGPEVAGGERSKKSHERALERAGILKADEYCVPGKQVPVDAYGNVAGSFFTVVLSQLKASPDASQNATGSRRSKLSRTRNGSFFVLRGTRARDGIYQRVAGVGRNPIKPVLLFVRAPNYKARFPFYDKAKAIFDQRFIANAQAGFDLIMARYRKAA